MIDTKTGAEVSIKTARERLHNRNGKNHEPLCLACGEKATNTLPTCNNRKCVKAVRPVHGWAKRVAQYAAGKRIAA